MLKIDLTTQPPVYRPGQPIKGTVSWSELNETAIEVRLIWFTSGKGDRDVECVAVQNVAEPGRDGSWPFEFTTPSRPLSFTGKLIGLTWAIEVITFPNQEAEQAELTISHIGKEIVLTPILKEDRIGKAKSWEIEKA